MSEPTLADLAAETAEADTVRFAAEVRLDRMVREQTDAARTGLIRCAVSGVRSPAETARLSKIIDRLAARVSDTSSHAIAAARAGDVQLQRRLLHLVRRMERVVAHGRAEMALAELDAAERALAAPSTG